MDGIKKRYEDTREYKEKMEHLREREKELIYFNPGDIVLIKHDIAYIPPMVVKSVDKEVIPGKNGMKTVLKGVTCFWFNNFGEIQEYQFSTKDLAKVSV